MELKIILDDVFPDGDDSIAAAVREAVVDEVRRHVRGLVRAELGKHRAELARRIAQEVASTVRAHVRFETVG